MPLLSEHNCLKDWLDHYVYLGRDFLTRTEGLSKDRAAQQDGAEVPLRQSLTYYTVTRGTGIAGLAPFGKTAVKKVGSTVFVNQALNAFGLKDQDALLNLMFESEAKSQLKKLFKDDAKHFWADEGMSEALKDELVSDFGEEAADEVIHLLPLVGQIYSVGSGVFGAHQTLDKVLDVTMEKARKVHGDIIVFAAVHRILPTKG